MDGKQKSAKEDDSLTIQYLRGRVTSLEEDKTRLEGQLKEYEHNEKQLKLIWQTIFPSNVETTVDVDKLRQEFTRTMSRTSELENNILCLKNRESELLLQLCESQKVIHKHQTQMVALKDELKSVSLRNRKAQFVDPVINHNFNLMLTNMNELNKKLKSSRDESLANGFNMQSQTGRSLIEKCKKLIIENQILGRQIQMNKNSNLTQKIILLHQRNLKLSEHIMKLNTLIGKGANVSNTNNATSKPTNA